MLENILAIRKVNPGVWGWVYRNGLVLPLSPSFFHPPLKPHILTPLASTPSPLLPPLNPPPIESRRCHGTQLSVCFWRTRHSGAFSCPSKGACPALGSTCVGPMQHRTCSTTLSRPPRGTAARVWNVGSTCSTTAMPPCCLFCWVRLQGSTPLKVIFFPCTAFPTSTPFPHTVSHTTFQPFRAVFLWFHWGW